MHDEPRQKVLDEPPLGTLAERPEGLSDAELLARLLNPDQPEVDAAAGLLSQFGGLHGLYIAAGRDCGEPAGPGGRAALQLHSAREITRRHLRQGLRRGEALTSPQATVEYLQTALRDRGREVFTCLFLDTRHRVIAAEDLFQGSIDGACVYPRVVAERALRLGAAAVIVAHNHPSGVAEPSLADQAITRRLKEALLLLEIRLLDHFVIGDGIPVSMAERGLI